jgi:hypothetical protein
VKEFLDVELIIVSQAGKSTNVYKHCVTQLQNVNVVLSNGFHISLLGYYNNTCFPNRQLQVRMLTRGVQQISDGIRELTFFTNAVEDPSLLVAHPDHGMSWEELD